MSAYKRAFSGEARECDKKNVWRDGKEGRFDECKKKETPGT